MSRVVFLLEERSMKVLLEGLLPRLFPNLPFLCVPHEGKRESSSRSFQVFMETIEALATRLADPEASRQGS